MIETLIVNRIELLIEMYRNGSPSLKLIRLVIVLVKRTFQSEVKRKIRLSASSRSGEPAVEAASMHVKVK